MSRFVGAVTNVPYNGSNYIDSLRWGTRWQIENDNRTLTYSFANNQFWDYDFLLSSEMMAFHNAMQAWANVANFELEFSGFNDPYAEIRFHSVNSTFIPDSAGVAIPPAVDEHPLLRNGDVVLNRDSYFQSPSAELILGSFDYMVYVHEIGHALGLAHPHDNGGNSLIFPGVGPRYFGR